MYSMCVAFLQLGDHVALLSTYLPDFRRNWEKATRKMIVHTYALIAKMTADTLQVKCVWASRHWTSFTGLSQSYLFYSLCELRRIYITVSSFFIISLVLKPRCKAHPVARKSTCRAFSILPMALDIQLFLETCSIDSPRPPPQTSLATPCLILCLCTVFLSPCVYYYLMLTPLSFHSMSV